MNNVQKGQEKNLRGEGWVAREVGSRILGLV